MSSISRPTRSTRCAATGCSRRSTARASAAGAGRRKRERDFISGALSSCGVASVAWSTAIAFDRQAFAKAQPSQIADLLDVQDASPASGRCPTARAIRWRLRCSPTASIPPTSIRELATPEGADRAFEALDKIKPRSCGGTTRKNRSPGCCRRRRAWRQAYSGRIFRAAVGARQRIGVLWDGQIYDLDLWAIPKGAKNKDDAKRFIAFATDPARLAAQAELIAYGPMRKSAMALVGKHPTIDIEMKDFLPTAPDNFKKALQFDEAWWSEHGAELQTRFEAWRGQLSPGQGKPPTKSPIRKAPTRPPAPPKPRPNSSRAKNISSDEDVAALLRQSTAGATQILLARAVLPVPHVKLQHFGRAKKENAGKLNSRLLRLSPLRHASRRRDSIGQSRRHPSYTECTPKWALSLGEPDTRHTSAADDEAKHCRKRGRQCTFRTKRKSPPRRRDRRRATRSRSVRLRDNCR